MSGSTLTWVGGGDNLASDPADWTPAVIPQPGDTLIINAGTVNVSGNVLASDSVVVPAMSSAVVFNVSGNASLDLDEGLSGLGEDTVNVNIASGSTLALTALISRSDFASSGGTISFAGTSTLAAFQTVLDSDLTGSGTIATASGNAAGESLEINGSVASGLTVVLSSGAADADLIIDKPAEFDGVIQLTQSPVTLGHVEFVGLQATSADLSSGILTLFDGGTLVDKVRLNSGGQNLQLQQTTQGVFLTAGTNNDVPNLGGTIIPLNTLAAGGNFCVQDATTGQAYYTDGAPYTGPVQGLTSEFVVNTSDILNVSAATPNAFIDVAPVAGAAPPAECGINVSSASGNNVLDGYATSNFYTGGTGTDQFYEDTRTMTQNSWSTIVNFHSGDNVTLWGVTQADFPINWIGDTYGATGSTGLTGVVVPSSGHPAIGITLAGYTTADLSAGKLSVTYGQTEAQGSTPGSAYMLIHAN